MELNEYFAILKARKNEIIGITFVVVLLALLFSALQKPIYRTTAVIEYRGTDVANRFLSQIDLPYLYNQPERLLATQAELITAEPLAEEVIRTLKLKTTPEQLLKKVTVSFEEKLDLISITIEDPDPKKAKLIANTFARLFLLNAKKSASTEISKAKDEVLYKMQDLEEDIQLYSQMSKVKDSPEGGSNNEQSVQSKIAVATTIYTDLSQKHQQLKIMEDLTNSGLRMAVPAGLPKWPAKPNLFLNTFLALVLGGVSGITWVVSADYLDNTLKSPEEIEKYFQLPIVGQIPRFSETEARRYQRTEGGEAVAGRPVLAEGSTFAAEAYRGLRTNIRFLNFENQARTMLVTSPGVGEGKSTVSANLATTLALMGGKVLLIDCDLRHPQIHTAFGLDNAVGISSVLVRSHSIQEALKTPRGPELSVITSGPQPPNPSELLGSERMSEVIDVLSDAYEYIIFDTPPVCLVTDAAVLASQVEKILLVSAFNATTRDAAVDSRRVLDKVDAKIMGVVVNKIDSGGGHRYYGYYGGRYYGADQHRYYRRDDADEQKAS